MYSINSATPGFMAIGSAGIYEMTEVQMGCPPTPPPMMTSDGSIGGIGMGGMFSVLKVRADQAKGDYRDPGWFKHPAGSLASPVASTAAGTTAAAAQAASAPNISASVGVNVHRSGQHRH